MTNDIGNHKTNCYVTVNQIIKKLRLGCDKGTEYRNCQKQNKMYD